MPVAFDEIDEIGVTVDPPIAGDAAIGVVEEMIDDGIESHPDWTRNRWILGVANYVGGVEYGPFRDAMISVGATLLGALVDRDGVKTYDMGRIVADVVAERRRQRGLGFAAGDADNQDEDWAAYITAYLGRAVVEVARDEREGCDHRENLVKALAIAVAAVEAHDAAEDAGEDDGGNEDD
jgi:hypothetical protein